MLQYSFQHTRRDQIWSTKRVPNAPEHQAGFKLAVPLADRHMRLALRAVVVTGRMARDNSTEAKPSFVWDITLSGEVPSINLRYSAGLRNLVDWRYGHPVGGDIQDLTVIQPGLTATAR